MAPITIAAGATATLTIPFAGGRFSLFRPVALVFGASDEGTNVAISAGAVTEVEHDPVPESLIEVTSVTVDGVELFVAAGSVPLVAFASRYRRGMYLGGIGDRSPASSPITIGLTNVCKTIANGGMGLTLRVSAYLVGWAKRAGGGVPAEPQGVSMVPAVP